MSDEIRMTALERYLSYKRVLERPTFNSVEEAEEHMLAAEGERRQFVVRVRPGAYLVCYCFVSTDREGNQRWAYNEEYTFLHCEMLRVCDRAALAVGRELVESM